MVTSNDEVDGRDTAPSGKPLIRYNGELNHHRSHIARISDESQSCPRTSFLPLSARRVTTPTAALLSGHSEPIRSTTPHTHPVTSRKHEAQLAVGGSGPEIYLIRKAAGTANDDMIFVRGKVWHEKGNVQQQLWAAPLRPKPCSCRIGCRVIYVGESSS